MIDHSTHYFGDGHAHGPCPTCGHDWTPDPRTPERRHIDAVVDRLASHGIPMLQRDALARDVLDAAYQAAPWTIGTEDGHTEGHSEGHTDTWGTGTPAAPAVTDEMVEAFTRVGHERWTDTFGIRIATALAAAFAAAPAVDGWVWCERLKRPARPLHEPVFAPDPCPGPHDDLIRRPKADR